MLQPRICRFHPLHDLPSTLSKLSLRPNCNSNPSITAATQIRHASHAQQGRANGPKDSAGRRLGAKKSNSEHVVPGNIIFKQRGTKWFPGENVGMGKDHTIYALAEGYVRYYRNPYAKTRTAREKKYIGVSLAREGEGSVLPTRPGKARERRVGMVAAPMKAREQEEADAFLAAHVAGNSKLPSTTPALGEDMHVPAAAPVEYKPIMRHGGYRIANVELRRQAEMNAVEVRPFKRGDRFYAWRQRTKKIKAKRMARMAGAGGKKKGKKKAAKAKATRK